MSIINTILNPVVELLPENNRLERIWKLAQVDFKKRYYNDKLGLLWALLNPASKIAIYYFVFSILMEDRRIENFALFLFAGLLLWMAFSECTNKAMGLIKSKKYLIENIQFNQIDLFISATISVFLGLGFNLIAYFFICLIMGLSLTWNVLYLVVILFNVFIICLGASLILATIGIYIKDIKHLWAIGLIAGFWTSGIFFEGELILEKFPAFVFINPFLGIIMNMRSISMYEQAPDFNILVINMIFGIVTFIVGIFVYKKFSHKAIELL